MKTLVLATTVSGFAVALTCIAPPATAQDTIPVTVDNFIRAESNLYLGRAVNNITANKNADGSIAVQFGGCDGNIPNCLPTMSGWNYTVRLYGPHQAILDGTWEFPEAQPVN